jgi:hypothetical protein
MGDGSLTDHTWRWAIGEAIERIRGRYQHIGRKTGAPFLALVYPPEEEVAVLHEWRTQATTLSPEFDLHTVNVLEVTQSVLADFGLDNVLEALRDPMPGSDPTADLGRAWLGAVVDAVHRDFAKASGGRPILCLERLAALYPVCGPQHLMQQMWDSAQSDLAGPVLVLIPGKRVAPRVYSFVELREEFMYRGDLI